MKKMLITGASGLLGGSIACSLSDKYKLTLLYNEHPIALKGAFSIKADLCSPGAAADTIAGLKPDIVVHCAAVTNVDFCEKEREKARLINCLCAGYVAEACYRNNCKLVYISTDSIFDGSRGGYSEEDSPNPVNYYAETKLMGEAAVKNAIEDYLILRTNMYGVNHQDKLSLSEWVLKTALDKGELSLFRDVYFNPMYTGDIAQVMNTAIENGLRGLYHIGCREGLSKLEFGKRVLELAGVKGVNIHEVSIEDMSFSAKRPKNTVLKTDKIQEVLNITMPGIDEGIKRFLDRLNEDRHVNGGHT